MELTMPGAPPVPEQEEEDVPKVVVEKPKRFDPAPEAMADLSSIMNDEDI